MDRRTFLATSLVAPLAGTARADAQPSRLLYVVCPGIRDYLEFGGAGVLVFDIDAGHKFVKRIVTDASKTAKPRNIKGVVASAATKKLHFTTPEALYCVDLVTERTDWGKELPQGCDRLAATPDGKTLFVPSFEKDIWNVVDAATGKVRRIGRAEEVDLLPDRRDFGRSAGEGVAGQRDVAGPLPDFDREVARRDDPVVRVPPLRLAVPVQALHLIPPQAQPTPEVASGL